MPTIALSFSGIAHATTIVHDTLGDFSGTTNGITYDETDDTLQLSTTTNIFQFDGTDGAIDWFDESGLVALWHMNEPSWNGTVGEAIDSSGSGYLLTSFNSANTTASGKMYRGGSFNATNLRFLHNKFAEVNGGFQSSDTQGTISLWFYANSFTNYTYLFSANDDHTGGYNR